MNNLKNLLLALVNNQDTLQTKLTLILKQIESKVEDNTITPYLPIISVIIGTLLAFIAQFLIKRYDNSQILKKEFISIKQNLSRNINSLYFKLKGLAYLKVDSNLQYYYSETQIDEYSKKKAQDEIYLNYTRAAELEEDIAKLYSDLYSDIINYHRQSKADIPNDVESKFEILRKNLLSLDKAKDFDLKTATIDSDVNTELERLYTVYFSKLIQIEKVIKEVINNNETNNKI